MVILSSLKYNKDVNYNYVYKSQTVKLGALPFYALGLCFKVYYILLLVFAFNKFNYNEFIDLDC